MSSSAPSTETKPYRAYLGRTERIVCGLIAVAMLVTYSFQVSLFAMVPKGNTREPGFGLRSFITSRFRDGEGPQYPEPKALFAYVAGLEPEAVVAFRKPYALTLYSGHQTTRLVTFEKDLDTQFAIVDEAYKASGVRYIIRDLNLPPASDRLELWIDNYLQRKGSSAVVAWQSPGAQYRVYKLTYP